ncbi:CYCD2 protein [Gonium pectorale]|uniref:CYCD2 protein n=1 Tax=Gonium pectorale TaxID=33097 RepID=A0A150GA37_GONPE|nr:CYCD2 protein [Gonium pectorale]|eukprot:KXZ46704.1 CYCD2 protein [Gonium pectorale]
MISSSAAPFSLARSDSEPDLPSPGDDQCSLECEEDGSSLGLPEASGLERCAEPAPQPFVSSPVFIAEDARIAIKVELERQSDLCYVPRQPAAIHFGSTDRPRIISWLVEVVTALGLSGNTLHTAVSLLDRFVANTETMPPEHVLQLLALACISLAAKHEEVSQYRPDEWVHLAVDEHRRPLYHRDDLKRMEWLLLETVDWRIRVPNTLTFLRHYHNALMNDADAWAEVARDDPRRAAAFDTCANFMADMSLLYDGFLPYSYSTVAIACLVLAEWNLKFADAGEAGGAAAPPQVRTVASLVALTRDADSTMLAPNLPICVEALHQLYSQVAPTGPDGQPPAGTPLGLLAPVVARYAPRV